MRCVAAALLLLMPAVAAGRTERVGRGAVVEKVDAGGAAEKAGVLEGDVLLSWRRAPNPPAIPRAAAGRFEGPLDVGAVEVEQAPRGLVTVRLERGRKPVEVTLPPGDWRLRLRPRFAGKDLHDWIAGARGVAEGGDARRRGLERWDALVSRARARGDAETACWAFLRLVEAHAAGQDADAADEAARRALGEAGATRRFLGAVWVSEGNRFQKAHELVKAEEAFRQALRSFQEDAPESLHAALALQSLGNVAYQRGDRPVAEDFARRALAMREREAPDSLVVAVSLNSLGVVTSDRGDLPAADAFYRRALTIWETLAPESPGIASILNNLGSSARDRGDFALAESLGRRALSIHEKSAPGGFRVAAALTNLGAVAYIRGDLAASEDLNRRACAIQEKIAPESLDVTYCLSNLGVISIDRGDLATAEGLFRRSLRIAERVAPDSIEHSEALTHLGDTARERGDLATAEGFFRRALSIQERIAPDTLNVAESLKNLGQLVDQHGDSSSAEELYRRSIAICERIAPAGRGVATGVELLGVSAASRGDLVAAEALHRQALTIRQKIAPEGLETASSLVRLAAVADKAGQALLSIQHLEDALSIFRRLAPDSTGHATTLFALGASRLVLGEKRLAALAWCEALQALEAQRGRLGGSEDTRATFAARYAGWYREYAELLVELGEPEEAFHVLERSRARGLLSMLAARDLTFGADVPAELERERKIAEADYDRNQTALAKLSATDITAIEELRSDQREIRRRQDDIAGRIRATSPKLASLRDPEPFDVAEARQAIDPGTLLLSYSVGKERGLLFAVGPAPGDFEVLRLAHGAEQLQRDVERFRLAIEQGGTHPEPGVRDEIRRRAMGLTDRLLLPVARKLAAARRLLIIPDGPLHFLPFTALAEPGPATRPFRWLIEGRPLHMVVSATIYGELRQGRKLGAQAASREGDLIAFGDPLYPVEAVAAVRRGLHLEPLQATRREVETIRSLSPTTTKSYLGADATEARARSLGKDTRFIHFACHGTIDERFPLDSALALTIPEKPPDALSEAHDENGLLQAWEILERVRLDADLVTLSACQTAMGREVGGEGLVGLVRAFQYAGARSVLASLWSVADESTAELMPRFYRGLREGLTKDEALRRAQLALIREPVTVERDGRPVKLDASDPFHWAAFQLAGDWR